MAKKIDPLELVLQRNEFYRVSHRRLSGALLLMVLVCIGLTIATVYLGLHQTPPQYFAVEEDGTPTPLYALSVPVVSEKALLNWAQEAAIAVYTYSFVDYRQKLQDASEYFTPDGWTKFESAEQQAGNLNTVIAKHLIASAVVTGPAVVVGQEVFDGRYTWKIQMPMLVSYQSASQQIQQPLLVTMVVARVSTLSFPKGIAIEQFFASARPLSTNGGGS